MKLTKREQQVIDYALAEAANYRRTAGGSYVGKPAQEYYRGMAAAMSRLADEVLNGVHRK